MGDSNQEFATLSCQNGYTSFDTGSRVIRFRTPRSLRRYTRVREWNDGYLVVDAKYDGVGSPVEEYIDLIPILKNLYLDPEEFLSPIKEVRVA